jgi:hypothetical protein
MGVFFYYSSRKTWMDMPEREVRRHMLGSEDIQVFFNPGKRGAEAKSTN